MSGRWNEIENHWMSLRDQLSFDFSVPCIVIDKDGDLFEHTLWDLLNYIEIPQSLLHNEIYMYLEAALDVGADSAKQMLIANKQLKSIDFFKQLSMIKQSARNITLGSIDDVLQAMNAAKTGFCADPRKMLVIQLGEYRADILLVSPPTNDGRK